MRQTTPIRGQSRMIVIGVSNTIFVIVMVLGVLAYLHDGAMALKRRQRRKDRMASLYGSSDRYPSTTVLRLVQD